MSKAKSPHPERRRTVYGRRWGRPLNASRMAALDDLLPLYKPDESLLNNGQHSPDAFFSRKYKNYVLEVGFGNGEFLSELCQNNPDTGYIGCDPFLNGVSALLSDIKDSKPDNIRIWPDDALKIIHALEDASVQTVYVLNPDPWPKTRHHKRRFISQENLNHLSRILYDGGRLVMATDVDDLAEWMLERTWSHPDFIWTARSSEDWAKLPDDMIRTRYANKGIRAGRKQTYLVFQRKKRD